MKKITTFFVIGLTAMNWIFGGALGSGVGNFLFNAMALEGESVIKVPEIYIKAINPGYTIDKKSNVGEMIEIGRKNSDALVSLAGLTVGYTNSSGDYTPLVEFPEHSFMKGETLLLRLSGSSTDEPAAIRYKVPGGSSGLTQGAGPLILKRGEEVVDSVCWTGGEGCYRKFKSGSGESLVRNLETGEFDFLTDYIPVYDSESYYMEPVQNEEGYGAMSSQCRGMMFSEILSYYETLKTEQFIELYNTTSEQILLDGCQIKYKNKFYDLNGVVSAEGYFVRYLTDFNITKNPTNSNTLELVDIDGTTVDKLVYPNGQRKGTSYAWIGYGENGEKIWKVTYAPTPGEANNYQEFKTCEEGKVINETTGNCVKVTKVAEKICKDGYYLNILTGRCKKYQTVAEKTCKEGYYLNPETGRCRKIVENNGTDYNVEPEEYEEKSSFVALYAVIGVIVVGLGYLIYEFRREIGKFLKKIFGGIFKR